MHALALLLVTTAAFGAAIDGPITIAYSENMFGKEVIAKEFGDTVKATTMWHAGDFFGKETVFAGIRVKNSAAKPMFFEYYVAFFDKDHKLIGASGQGSFGDEGLKPGEETQMGSCLIHLPKDRYKDITSYQAVIYETDQKPVKK